MVFSFVPCPRCINITTTTTNWVPSSIYLTTRQRAYVRTHQQIKYQSCALMRYDWLQSNKVVSLSSSAKFVISVCSVFMFSKVKRGRIHYTRIVTIHCCRYRRFTTCWSVPKVIFQRQCALCFQFIKCALRCGVYFARGDQDQTIKCNLKLLTTNDFTPTRTCCCLQHYEWKTDAQ